MSASIVVPSRAGARRLPVLLESARRQTDPDFEVIVVLDGDVDGSEAVLQSCGGGLETRSIVFPENRGRAAALNAGYAAANGDVFIRVDDDLELEPDFVERHARLHRDGHHGVVAMCHDVFPDSAYARAYGIRADERIRSAAFATPSEYTWRWWSGNVSTTREDHLAVGEYDESFRAYGWEDVDWGYRLHLLGRPVLIAPGFTTKHHGPVTSVRERAARALASGAARLRFERKHGLDALPPETMDAGAWNRLVSTTALLATPRSLAAAGSVLDRSLDLMPRWMAQKCVALLVESAGLAGRRYPHRIKVGA